MSGSTREAPSSRFLFPGVQDFLTPVGQAVNGDFLGDEEALVRSLADMARVGPAQHDEVQATARRLVQAVRRAPAAKTDLHSELAPGRQPSPGELTLGPLRGAERSATRG